MSHKTNRDLAIRRLREIYDFAEATQTDHTRYDDFIPRYENLDKVVNSFETAHERIIAKLTDEIEINNEDQIRKDFDNQCYAIQKLFKEITKQMVKTEPMDSSSQVNNSSKLPKINLPVFDGNFKNWPSFIALFNSMVYNKTNLSKIEKFQYLVTSLSDFNQLSVKRYQDKRKLVFMYWEEIVNSKLTTTSNSDLRKLLDTFTENLLILETFELPFKSWDFVLFHLLLSKLDRDTRERFELKYTSVEIPTFNNLVSFVEEQCTAIGRVDHQPSKAVSSSRKPISKSPSTPCSSSKSLSFVVSTDPVKDNKCSLCNSSHPLHKCPDFLNKLPLDRYNLVRASRGCLNCLAFNHFVQKCSSKQNCRTCGRRHHTLLHFQEQLSPAPSNSTAVSAADGNITPAPCTSNSKDVGDQSNSIQVVNTTVSNESTVLLSTTVVQILDSAGKYQAVRALIDQGSQANFITENCLRKLGLPVTPLNTPISGVNQMSSIVSKGTTTSSIKPLDRLNPTFSFKALIVPTICRKLPSSEIPLQSWSYLKDLKLADPYFNKSLGIDILIGAELYPSILKSGYVIRPAGQPSAINTVFGWVLMGRVDFEPSTVTSFCVTLDSSLDSIVRRFWELEELPPISNSSPDDIQCEKLGGFVLRKWASNHHSLLPVSSNPDDQTSLSFDVDTFVKILGLQWQPSLDVFSYHVTLMDRTCTKRTILSELARIFDPLGFLSPVTIFSKLLVQKLWTLGLGWDETPPSEILSHWELYKFQLPSLSSLKLNRRLTVDSVKQYSLHGFADASEAAYASWPYYVAALHALKSPRITSQVVLECTNSLAELGQRNKVRLVWVPGHCGVTGNEEADALARKGSTDFFTGPKPAVGLPYSYPQSSIDNWTREKCQEEFDLI
ncbi:hypothetical protein NQ315_014270 [Exocentrus adspersus]|uniref:RNase H type-1 domain-containing protein n=1 Tax=Exocentrus adspersus TaxID=1586481 RepID=A0AAV8VJL1_9CUCU|nr:hypothetical protein NQ315_014270 [Exocentrus adspersus]